MYNTRVTGCRLFGVDTSKTKKKKKTGEHLILTALNLVQGKFVVILRLSTQNGFW